MRVSIWRSMTSPSLRALAISLSGFIFLIARFVCAVSGTFAPSHSSQHGAVMISWLISKWLCWKVSAWSTGVNLIVSRLKQEDGLGVTTILPGFGLGHQRKYQNIQYFVHLAHSSLIDFSLMTHQTYVLTLRQGQHFEEKNTLHELSIIVFEELQNVFQWHKQASHVESGYSEKTPEW